MNGQVVFLATISRRQGGTNKRTPKETQGNEVVYEKDHYRLSLLRQLDRETRKAYFTFRS